MIEIQSVSLTREGQRVLEGIDLVLQAVPDLMRMGCQLCVLGAGDRPLEDALQRVAAAHQGRIAVRIGFDEGLAHLIEAGADAFLTGEILDVLAQNRVLDLLARKVRLRQTQLLTLIIRVNIIDVRVALVAHQIEPHCKSVAQSFIRHSLITLQ